MGVPANTFDAFGAIGNREDLSDIIYNVAPTETPFLSMISGRGSATSVTHEWQTDSLAAAALNTQIEGEDPTNIAIVATQRVLNNTQISEKTIQISGTQEAVDKAGRRSELAYQLSKVSKEIKRDMEFGLTQNTARNIGVTITTARQSAGLETWYLTAANADRGAGGAATASTNGTPDDTKQPTDGTQRALTETILKNVIRNVWNSGGDPSIVMVGPFNKQTISGFTGNSTRFDRGEDKRLVAAVDIYVSDYGDHRVVPNRFSRDRTAHVITPRLYSVDYLRSFRQHPLAKTGDSERRQLLAEYTLRSSNEAGSGVAADLTTS